MSDGKKALVKRDSNCGRYYVRGVWKFLGFKEASEVVEFSDQMDFIEELCPVCLEKQEKEREAKDGKAA